MRIPEIVRKFVYKKSDPPNKRGAAQPQEDTMTVTLWDHARILFTISCTSA